MNPNLSVPINSHDFKNTMVQSWMNTGWKASQSSIHKIIIIIILQKYKNPYVKILNNLVRGLEFDLTTLGS